MRNLILSAVSLLAFVSPAAAEMYGAVPAGQDYAYAYGTQQIPLAPSPLPSYQAQQQMAYAPQAAVYATAPVQRNGEIPTYLPAARYAGQAYVVPAGYTVAGTPPAMPTAPAPTGYVPAGSYEASSTYASSYSGPAQAQYAAPAYGQPQLAMQPAPQAYAAPVYQAPSDMMQQQAAVPQAPVYDMAYAQQAAPAYGAQPGYGSASSTTQSSYYQSTTTAPVVQGAVVPETQMMAPQPAPQSYYYSNQPQVQAYEASSGPLMTETAPLLATEPGNQNWYFGLRSGFTVPSDTEFNIATAKVANDYKTGWLLGMMLGKSFRPWGQWVAPRLEADINFSQQDIDGHKVGGAARTEDPNAFGDVTNFDFLINGFLDFKLTKNIFPYIGGGAGLGFSDFDRHGVNAAGVVMDDSGFGFAWQAGAGVAFPVANGTLLDVGYRFQQNPDIELTARDGTKTDVTTAQHIFLLGLRQNF